jgi:hypothetical protein
MKRERNDDGPRGRKKASTDDGWGNLPLGISIYFQRRGEV